MIFVFLSPYEICLQSDRFCFHGYWFLSSRSNPWLLRVYIPSFQFILQVFLYPSIILSYTFLLYKLLLFKFIILQVFIHQVVSHFFCTIQTYRYVTTQNASWIDVLRNLFLFCETNLYFFLNPKPVNNTPPPAQGADTTLRDHAGQFLYLNNLKGYLIYCI